MTPARALSSYDPIVSFNDLEMAIVHTVAYADVFDYPLTPEEIHRYLEAPASLQQVHCLLADGGLIPDRLVQIEGFITLPGREGIVYTRRQRAERAAQLWPLAIRYARLIAELPFVRMVALTGSLAMDNADARSDLDYFVVTAVDRLWLCRALILPLVRWAARRGNVICPNYFLSERALSLEQRDLFMARELAQMTPLFGLDVYERVRELNAWSATFLPNASGPPPQTLRHSPRQQNGSRLAKRAAEAMLRTPVGARLDRWEMQRKVRKFKLQYPDQSEASFSPDWCKGHFEGHGQRIMAAFSDRIHILDEAAL